MPTCSGISVPFFCATICLPAAIVKAGIACLRLRVNKPKNSSKSVRYFYLALENSSHCAVASLPPSMSTSLWKTLSHLKHLILTILINSCQTSGFSKVGAIIKCNIMHFPVLIKTVLNWFTLSAIITLSGKLFQTLTIRLVKQYFKSTSESEKCLQ